MHPVLADQPEINDKVNTSDNKDIKSINVTLAVREESNVGRFIERPNGAMDFGWPQYQNPIAFFESSIYVIIVNLNEMRKAKTAHSLTN